MKTQKKLSLKKEKVATLSREAQTRVMGGMAEKSGNSSEHNFTCCWCTDIHISNTKYITTTG